MRLYPKHGWWKRLSISPCNNLAELDASNRLPEGREESDRRRRFDFDENRDEKLGWSRSNLSTARLGLISIVRCHNPWLSLITQSDLGIVEIVDSLSRLYRVYLIPEGDGGGEEMKLIRCSKRSKFYLNLS